MRNGILFSALSAGFIAVAATPAAAAIDANIGIVIGQPQPVVHERVVVVERERPVVRKKVVIIEKHRRHKEWRHHRPDYGYGRGHDHHDHDEPDVVVIRR